MSARGAAPAGAAARYERFAVGDARVVAAAEHVRAVADAIASAGSLYRYAERHPAARALAGRAVAYAAPLPGGTTRVVVRHSRHGGLLAPLTGDRFLAPTRAPRELAASLRLAAAGVPTPEVVAYAVYPAGPLLRRSDVATRELAGGRDLAAVLLETPDARDRRPSLEATAILLRALAAAGARHADLNLKNILLAPADDGAARAYVLDVDRVTFGRAGDAGLAAANLRRLARSARKWRDLHAAHVDEDDLAWLAAAAGAPDPT